MKLIYLHLYKDTYLIFISLQVNLHVILNLFKNFEEKNLVNKIKSIY